MGSNSTTNERHRLAHGIEVLAQEFLVISGQHPNKHQFAREIRTFSTFQLVVILSIVAENVGEAKGKQDADELARQEGWREALLEELSDRV
jgi:hypothetical protein